jgi:hypothetical protein
MERNLKQRAANTRMDCRQQAGASAGIGGYEGRDAQAEFLRLDDVDVLEATAPEQAPDPFGSQLAMPNAPIVADKAALQQLSQAEVVVRRWANPHIPAQYYRVMDPHADIVVGPCGHFFEALEYEMLSMIAGSRPFSREPLRPGDELGRTL